MNPIAQIALLATLTGAALGFAGGVFYSSWRWLKEE